MADAPTRRLAAILAADAADYSRMMGADEAGTFNALKTQLRESVEPLVAEHGGRVFKTTGDGLLAEFPSAVAAVECAVAVQRACTAIAADAPPDKRLQFRIGINLGDVIADGADLFGDGVNVAARLEGIAEPGGICISQAVYEQVAGKTSAAFSRLGPRTLKNIAAPVQVFRVDLEDTGPGIELPPPVDDRPSIAVLPFENLSDDKSLDLLMEGLVEDVITLLARVPGFFVIARRSSFAYRDHGADLRRVGRELGVRYIVQGSVRASRRRVRISVQLADAETCRQLWTHRFDADRSETLDLQDEIARSIMVELEPQLTRAELAVIHRQRPDNLDALSHFRKASGVVMLKGWSEETVAEAIAELKESVRLDPRFALGHSLLALHIAFGVNLSLLEDGPEVRRHAKEAAERAIALDPDSSEVLGRAGCAIADLGENERGCEILERAVEIDPSNPQPRVALGAAQCRLGRFDAGIENMRLGMRISPRDANLAFWSMLLGDALLKAGRSEEALAEAQTANRRDGQLYGGRVVSAVAAMRLGRNDDARRALAAARRIRPALTLAEIEKFFGPTAAADLKPIWDVSEAKAPA